APILPARGRRGDEGRKGRWRRGSESNRRTRLCRPTDPINHSTRRLILQDFLSTAIVDNVVDICPHCPASVPWDSPGARYGDRKAVALSMSVSVRTGSGLSPEFGRRSVRS